MNKTNFARSYKAAEIIYKALTIKSDCFIKTNKPVRTDFIIAMGDDPASALWASWLYHKVHAEYGYRPAVICAGRDGLLSRRMYGRSSSKLLKGICDDLSVSPQNIGVLPLSSNIGEIIRQIKKIIPAGQTAIWCVPQRQSLCTERAVSLKAPEIISRYFVIEEMVDKASKMTNNKNPAQMEIMFHEVAGILERCERCAESGQKPLGDMVEITPEIREADDFLRHRYRLNLMKKNVRCCGKEFKVTVKNLRSVFQYLKLLYLVNKNRRAIKHALSLQTTEMAAKISWLL